MAYRLGKAHANLKGFFFNEDKACSNLGVPVSQVPKTLL
jgi:hypothetical protein